MMQMNMLTMQVMRIESEHNEELVDLALDLALEETGTDRDWYQFDLTLGGTPPQTGGFQMKQKEKPKFEMPKSFDIDVETDEEQFQSEVDKRNVINLIIQGEAKKGHYSFMKPSYMTRIAQIDPQLPTLYRQIMAASITNRIFLFILLFAVNLSQPFAQSFKQEYKVWKKQYKKNFREDPSSPLGRIGITRLRFFKPNPNFSIPAKLELLNSSEVISFPTTTGKTMDYIPYAKARFEVYSQPCELTIYKSA